MPILKSYVRAVITSPRMTCKPCNIINALSLLVILFILLWVALSGNLLAPRYIHSSIFLPGEATSVFQYNLVLELLLHVSKHLTVLLHPSIH